ncbi:MAG: 50S ribosomal protein L32 [Endomicrobium sp.]|nr:50S ribosomal protein L32 [Endomicrobium sp.]
MKRDVADTNEFYNRKLVKLFNKNNWGESKKMPNPKRKHTPHRRDCRRSANSKLDVPNLSKCPSCDVAKLPHKVCSKCGFYNGKLVIAKKIKKSVKTPRQ